MAAGEPRIVSSLDDRGAVTLPPRGASSAKPILVIVHQHHSNPGRVGQWLRNHGYPLDIRRPRFGCPLPESLDDHTGVVIFGGPMSANDEDAFVREETDWIKVPLREGKPFLGICLGAQMLARHLGSSVAPHPDGCVEVGYYPLEATEAGKAVCDWPSHFYQWHTEGFGLPDGATLLARGTTFPNQAFAYRSAAAVQFHSEITYALVNRWTVGGRHRLPCKGARPRTEHLSGHIRHSGPVGTWLDGFLPAWLEGRIGAASPKADIRPLAVAAE